MTNISRAEGAVRATLSSSRHRGEPPCRDEGDLAGDDRRDSPASQALDGARAAEVVASRIASSTVSAGTSSRSGPPLPRIAARVWSKRCRSNRFIDASILASKPSAVWRSRAASREAPRCAKTAASPTKHHTMSSLSSSS